MLTCQISKGLVSDLHYSLPIKVENSLLKAAAHQVLTALQNVNKLVTRFWTKTIFFFLMQRTKFKPALHTFRPEEVKNKDSLTISMAT